LFALGVLVAMLTTFYMFRLFYVAFVGTPRTEVAGHAHESPKVMTSPLLVLALFAVIGGIIGAKEIYRHHFFDVGHFQFISPENDTSAGAAEWNIAQIDLAIGNATPDKTYVAVFPSKTLLQKIFEPFTDSPGVALLGLSAVAIGFFMARKFYLNTETDPLPARLGGLATAMKNKFYFDEIYEATFIRAHDFIAAVMDWIDRWLVEGFCIGLVRGGTDFTGRALRLVQTGNLQTYALLFVLGVAAVLYFVLK
jgi:NADH-quinone oxidoreductase subunit L